MQIIISVSDICAYEQMIVGFLQQQPEHRLPGNPVTQNRGGFCPLFCEVPPLNLHWICNWESKTWEHNNKSHFKMKAELDSRNNRLTTLWTFIYRNQIVINIFMTLMKHKRVLIIFLPLQLEGKLAQKTCRSLRDEQIFEVLKGWMLTYQWGILLRCTFESFHKVKLTFFSIFKRRGADLLKCSYQRGPSENQQDIKHDILKI